jgi:molybdopterin/thiamine biosynthesis adenylyltransferase
MDRRLARQSFLGAHSDTVLAATRVGLVGVGGGGSHLALQLAHLGVGRFVVVDPDCVEDTNLNRIVGATAEVAARRTPKVEVATRVIRAVNASAEVLPLQRLWQERGEPLRDCSAIFGCVDSVSARNELEIAARRYLVPYLDIGMDVHPVGTEFAISGQVILSTPGELCMRCLGLINEAALAREAALYGAAGAKPQVVWPNGVLASAAVGLFVQLITPWHAKPVVTEYLEYDGNAHVLTRSNRLAVMLGRTCPHFTSIENLGDPFWKST